MENIKITIEVEKQDFRTYLSKITLNGSLEIIEKIDKRIEKLGHIYDEPERIEHYIAEYSTTSMEKYYGYNDDDDENVYIDACESVGDIEEYSMNADKTELTINISSTEEYTEEKVKTFLLSGL